MKKIIFALIVILIIGLGFWVITTHKDTPDTSMETATTTDTVDLPNGLDADETSIGMSEGGFDIPIYHYGSGDKEVLFVGGIHGGYEWNTTLLAYELMDFLDENPDEIAEGVKVSVVPVLNPDGLNKVVGTTGRFARADAPTVKSETVPGRFNANNVDLNRNFDCDWQATGVWQDTSVSGGTSAFSESESAAIRDYVMAHNPAAVVVFYSSAGGVFSSNCHDGVSDETAKLTKIYSEASGYPAYQEFDFYEITGDMVNWLAKEGVPAISVLLTDHENVEWEKNWKGIDAVLESVAK